MDDATLPQIHRSLPVAVRLLLIASGVATIVLPLWELGHGVWPLNIATPVFALIIGGAATLGCLFIEAGLRGEGQRWSFPPGCIVIHRSGWRRERETRLTAADLVSIDVRRNENSDGPDTWRVVLVPSLHARIEGAEFAARAIMFATPDYATQALADDVRARLVEHLRWPAG